MTNAEALKIKIEAVSLWVLLEQEEIVIRGGTDPEKHTKVWPLLLPSWHLKRTFPEDTGGWGKPFTTSSWSVLTQPILTAGNYWGGQGKGIHSNNLAHTP
jgi:hypothetical protein